ncbi:hypothetical protein JJV70_06585 [Streptomyces sp. JJ66]|uniref:hypothetical protein n=1 Tax=Streptomyces sp. JJ66 TaxID=2803843 RepID=UPI001C57A29F|nr:hypothetical protein [Streptomyces sp. JJ66]MBW1601782.1 hypothetical protein [Streptomyces sp. JJ66]
MSKRRYTVKPHHEDDMACGEGHCICYCVGLWHPCGCGCPRCPWCYQPPEDCDCGDYPA